VTLNAIYIDVEGMLSYVQLVGDFTKSEALGLVDMSKVKELETLLFGDNIPLEVRHRVLQWRKYYKQVQQDGWTDCVGKHYFVTLFAALLYELEPLDLDMICTGSVSQHLL
jgi:hypothetical protein